MSLLNKSQKRPKEIAILNFPSGHKIEVCHNIRGVHEGKADGLIIEGLWGFNDLGSIFGRHLGLDRKRIEPLFIANQQSDDITVSSFLYAGTDSTLKAIAFVPTENSRCYQKLATSFYGRPYRDFYYNTVYEALGLLTGFGCADVAIAGLTGSERHSADIELGNCVAEAIAHFAIENKSLRSVLSVGYGGPNLSNGIKYFNEHPENIGRHRNIQSEITIENDITSLSFVLPQ